MKHIFYVFFIVLLAGGCRRQPSDGDALLTQCIVRGDSTATARNFYEAGHHLVQLADSLPLDVAPDSALHVLLFAADYAKGSSDHALNYNIHRQLALQYEAKNLFSLQQESQRTMLAEARLLADPYCMAEARQQMAITTLAMGADDAERQARRLARQAYADAPADSAAFRAETLLFLAQTHIAAEQTDSAALLLQRAKEEWPAAAETDLYRLSSIYIHAHEGRTDEALALIHSTDDVYVRMEAWRLVRDLAAERSTIAPSSVAVRKQRMKKKFDDRQAEQSLDNYLTQYS